MLTVMSVRYIYQLIRELDEKIGLDLRGVVEQYLGPDREFERDRHHCILQDMINWPWCTSYLYMMSGKREIELIKRVMYENPYAYHYTQWYQFRLLWRGRQIWSYHGAHICIPVLEGNDDRVRLKMITRAYPAGVRADRYLVDHDTVRYPVIPAMQQGPLGELTQVVLLPEQYKAQNLGLFFHA